MRATFLVLLCWIALSPFPAAAAEPHRATRERRVSFADQTQEVRAGLRRIRASLHRIVLPDINIQAGSFGDAIKAIQQGFRERDPEHLGLSILFKRPASEPRPIGEPSLPVEPAPPISLKLHSASVAETFDVLCAQGDYVWYVDLYSVTILPAEEFASVRRRHSP